jgi:hypothetical protein
MIGVATDGRKDNGNVPQPENASASDARGVIINPTNRHVTGQINSFMYRSFERHGITHEAGAARAFALQIPNQRNRFILPDVTGVKALAIQIACFDFIVVPKLSIGRRLCAPRLAQCCSSARLRQCTERGFGCIFPDQILQSTADDRGRQEY